MHISEFYIVFPEGDFQEIPARLRINDIVDINGNRLSLPLPTHKMIAFQVEKISCRENKGISQTLHFLKLLSADYLAEYTDNA